MNTQYEPTRWKPDMAAVEDIARELAGEGFDACDAVAQQWMDASADDDVASFRRAAHRYFGGTRMSVSYDDAERAFTRLRALFVDSMAGEYIDPALDDYFKRGH